MINITKALGFIAVSGLFRELLMPFIGLDGRITMPTRLINVFALCLHYDVTILRLLAWWRHASFIPKANL